MFAAVENCGHHCPAVAAEHASVVGHGVASGEAPDHIVDHLGGNSAEEGVLTVFTDGSNHVISLRQLFHQLVDFFRRILEDRIQRDDVFAARLGKPGCDRRMLSEIGGEKNTHDFSGMFFRGIGDHFRGPVRATVIDQKNFIGASDLVAGGNTAVHQFLQVQFFIVHRYDNG
ncbi:hypothetical protein SDC9_170575 [bioreactor metagenome]|uniref:Uncharacterized protein n=1 Tax=bioreactor metagenome TaxID=1076179 RepID=A0A645G8F9_9ZZZZ